METSSYNMKLSTKELFHNHVCCRHLNKKLVMLTLRTGFISKVQLSNH